MSQEMIGRREEKKLLKNRISSKEAEFIALYGRRRVGKTYLITHVLAEVKANCIEITDLKESTLKDQLDIINRAFEKTFQPAYPIASPSNWIEAFSMLTKAIDQLQKNKRFVIFLDELPWLAT